MSTNTCIAEQLTTIQRIWRRLGFGYPGRELMEDLAEDPRFCESYLSQTTELYFDWKDRLRILLSGRVVVESSVKTDKPIDIAVTRSRTGVLVPARRPRPWDSM